ncbi:hypothetical protein Goari_020549, partial [Gossypium aridum]|nr:hypothetical protein [Gossypium aridum]
IRRHKFLEVTQLVWGLNNQKIAFVRACLTARMLNRTLLMPNLSASLFYKEINSLQLISFDKVFKFERFNTLYEGFVQLARYSDLKNRTGLKQNIINGPIDMHKVIRMVGKNPFLWHGDWPVKYYERFFECLMLVEDISKEADKVVSKIRQIRRKLRSEPGMGSSLRPAPYVAVYIRVEINWIIHCKKLEQRSGVSQICSNKQEIIERVGKIINLEAPIIVYLAIADNLINDSSLLSGWNKGLVLNEKKNLGVDGIFKKHPYPIQSAIDNEVCSVKLWPALQQKTNNKFSTTPAATLF